MWRINSQAAPWIATFLSAWRFFLEYLKDTNMNFQRRSIIQGIIYKRDKESYQSRRNIRWNHPFRVVGRRRNSMDAEVANSQQTTYGKYSESQHGESHEPLSTTLAIVVLLGASVNHYLFGSKQFLVR